MNVLLWIGVIGFGVLLLLAFLSYAVVLGVVMEYNGQLRRKHGELVTHMLEHHPDVAPRIELLRIGPFYPSGAYRPSILYARSHPDLDDPKAEELLADYARFAQLSTLFVLFGERLSAMGSFAKKVLSRHPARVTPGAVHE